MKNITVFIAICMLVIAASHAAEAAVSCTNVENSLKSCIPHLQSKGTVGTPPAACCDGVKAVKALADSSGDRKGVCQCMKDVASRTTGLNFDLAAKLPNQCGVTMSYTLNPNTDCSKV